MKRHRKKLILEKVINDRFEFDWTELKVLVLFAVQLQISLVSLKIQTLEFRERCSKFLAPKPGRAIESRGFRASCRLTIRFLG